MTNDNPSVYHVVNINAEGEDAWSADIEISATDIVLHRDGDRTYWPLMYVRRYGCDADTFSFECGRRSVTGEGVFAFRSRQARALFRDLEDHLHRRTYFAGNGGNFPSFPRSNRDTTAGDAANNPRIDEVSVDSSYLEPNRNQMQSSRFHQASRLGSVSSGPISPGSPSSFNNILEVTPLPNTSIASNHHVSNVYQELPLAGKNLSLDVPPQEQAPTVSQALLNDEELRVYENTSPTSVKTMQMESRQYMNLMIGEGRGGTDIETPTTTRSFHLLRLDSGNDPSRCYENMEPLLTHMRHSKPEIFSKVDLPARSADHSEPTTPTSPNSPGRGVTYVMLDLNNPNSAIDEEEQTSTPSNSSNNNNNSSTTNNNVVASSSAETAADAAARKISNLSFSTSFDSNSTFIMTNPKSMVSSKSLGGLESDKTNGYAQIDFQKTEALQIINKNSFGSPTNEGGRRTRHNNF